MNNISVQICNRDAKSIRSSVGPALSVPDSRSVGVQRGRQDISKIHQINNSSIRFHFINMNSLTRTPIPGVHSHMQVRQASGPERCHPRNFGVSRTPQYVQNRIGLSRRMFNTVHDRLCVRGSRVGIVMDEPSEDDYTGGNGSGSGDGGGRRDGHGDGEDWGDAWDGVLNIAWAGILAATIAVCTTFCQPSYALAGVDSSTFYRTIQLHSILGTLDISELVVKNESRYMMVVFDSIIEFLSLSTDNSSRVHC